MSTIERRIDSRGIVWEKTGRWSIGVWAKIISSKGEPEDNVPYTLHFSSWEAMRVAPGYPERRWGFWDGEGAKPSIARGRELYNARMRAGGSLPGAHFVPWQHAEMAVVDRYVTYGRDEEQAREWHEAAGGRPWDQILDDEKVDFIRTWQTRPREPGPLEKLKVLRSAMPHPEKNRYEWDGMVVRVQDAETPPLSWAEAERKLRMALDDGEHDSRETR